MTTDPVDHMRAGEVRVSALPPVTAAQIDRLREEEELLDLYDAVREARRTEPQRRAAAEAAAEAEFIERASRAHLDAADAVATAIVAGARGGTGIEVGFAEQVAAQVRAGAALRPPPSTGELRRRFRVQREQERRRERESRRGVPSRALHARDESPPKRDQRGHHDWCFDPAKGLGASSAVYRPDRRWRRTIRRHQRRREANGGAPF